MDPTTVYKYFVLIVKNLRRGLVRSILTALGTMALVLVVTMVWSVLYFLEAATSEKSANLKLIVTERWQLPSQMPMSYASALETGAAKDPGDIEPLDSMTWQFYGGTLDKDQRTRDNSLFAFAMEPKKLLTMMDDLDNLKEPEKGEFALVVEKLEANRQGIILGKDRLTALNKRVGERIKLFGLNYRDIDLELEIVGQFPSGRYDGSAVINREYVLQAMDQYAAENNGTKHPLADKTLNLMWLRVPDQEAFRKIAAQIENSPNFTNPAVKCETASSGISSFLEAYADLLFGIKWIFVPIAILSLSLVISNAISISVRERRLELAVMKVLGFRPVQILFLVLGEALVLGGGAGFVSAFVTWFVVNRIMGGIKFPIAFFPSFAIPDEALWWGPLVGGLAALIGTVIPAVNACRVKVTDVFARVT